MNNYLMLLEASTSASGKGSFQMIILMVLLFVGMYFLMIRPQKKQQTVPSALSDSLADAIDKEGQR